MIVINWINKVQKCQNIALVALYEEVNRLLSNFDVITYHHVYRVRNVEADRLSKARLNLEPGTWIFLETIDAEVHEFSHRPFIDSQPRTGNR